jgi:SAM-dependent methyltransferase
MGNISTMSPDVYKIFEEICQLESPIGPILEVGSVPGPSSLLNMWAITKIVDKTGINIDPFPNTDNIKMVTGNANHMDMFPDGFFGCVLCNSTLEHDGRFWETLSEIRRVTQANGLIVIGVPGFRGMGPSFLAPPESYVGRVIQFLARISRSDALLAGTSTLGEHFFPGDYYRFTEQAVMEIFLEDLVQKRIKWVMTPPRIIGWARKPS